MDQSSYEALQNGELVEEMIASPGWSLFCERFEQIKDGLLARLVAGVEDFTTYRGICHALETLGDIERIPGEYREAANQVRENLSDDEHG